MHSRADILKKPGVYLDRSPTGVGKSTADLEAVKLCDKALICVPTHKNCEQVEADMQAAGINARAYPRRINSKKKQSRKNDFDSQADSEQLSAEVDENCWNEEADEAESLGLSAVAAVCRTCRWETDCLKRGYLAELAATKNARVTISTHMRAVYTRLNELAEGREEYVAVHEDAAKVICPTAVALEADLRWAAGICNDLLNDPKKLDKFGESERRDEDGQWISDSAYAQRQTDRYEFVRHLADIADDLIALIQSAERTIQLEMPSAMEQAAGIENLLFRESRRRKSTLPGKSPWRLLLAIATGYLASLGVIVTDDDRDAGASPDAAKQKYLIGMWRNLPNADSVVLFADATANAEDLEALLGRSVSDVTPTGHIERVKRIVQYPQDVTKHTAKNRFLSLLRGILVEHKHCSRVGVITHQKLKGYVRELEEPFFSRIEMQTHFHSGEDRASNTWHKECDLVIVLGTPRLPTLAVQTRLIQWGDFAAAGRDGNWGDLHWRGKTESGKEVVTAGRGYNDPAWERAHRSLVRAGIIQSAGRGRSSLEDGCEVVVVTTEECGFPIADVVDIELDETDAKLLATLAGASPVFPYRDIQGISGDAPVFKTADLARIVDLAESQTRDRLTRLESRGLIVRVGERGGWRLSTIGHSVS